MNEAQDVIDGIEAAMRTSLASRILAQAHDEAVQPFERPALRGDEDDDERLIEALAGHATAVDYQRVRTIRALDRAIDPLVDELDAATVTIARLRMSEVSAARDARQWRQIAFALWLAFMVVLACLP